MRIGIGLDFGTTNSSIALARPDRSSEAVLFSSNSGSGSEFTSVAKGLALRALED